MPVFETHRELKNGERFDRFPNYRMNETNSSETWKFWDADSGNTDSYSKWRILTQEDVDE